MPARAFQQELPLIITNRKNSLSLQVTADVQICILKFLLETNFYDSDSSNSREAAHYIFNFYCMLYR